MLKRALLPLMLLFSVSVTTPGSAQGCSDASGSADHPKIPRYEGSCLFGYETRSFDEITIVTGAAERVDGEWRPQSATTLEGQTTRLLYMAPHGRSVLEVYRNYEAALKERGFEIQFSCAGDACGGNPSVWTRLIYPKARELTNSQRSQMAMAAAGRKDNRYLVARSADGTTQLGLFMLEAQLSHVMPSAISVRALAYLDVVDMAAIEQRMVDSSAMAQSLGETGRIAIDNVYFDFGQATLRPESRDAISEMAKLLAENPDLDIYIVGHTDAIGTYAANLDLSRRRAESVVDALASQHGIDQRRTVPAGVGPLSPLATNTTEAGRALNRRVELVQR
jgi:OOP family OmpA-OmpF porin